MMINYLQKKQPDCTDKPTKKMDTKTTLAFFPWCLLENNHSVRRSHCLRHPRQLRHRRHPQQLRHPRQPRHQRKWLKQSKKRNQRRQLRSRWPHGRGNPVVLSSRGADQRMVDMGWNPWISWISKLSFDETWQPPETGHWHLNYLKTEYVIKTWG